MLSIDEINQLIAGSDCDTNLISDGFHTFGELYEHRVGLFIALCRKVVFVEKEIEGKAVSSVWRSRRHSDGELQVGWFVMGIGSAAGEQISYHLLESMWDETAFAETLELAPEFDGHTSEDVLTRLPTL